MSILDAVMQVGGPPAVLLHPEAAAASTPTHAARRQPPARASGASGFVRPGRQWPEAGPLASERHRIGGVGFSATPPGVCSCSPSRRDTPQAAWQRTGVRRCRAAPAGSHLPGRGRTGVEGRRVPPHAVLTLSRGASWRFKGPRQCRLGRGAWGTTRGPEAVFDAPVGGPRAVGCSAWGASGRTMEREALKPAPGYALSRAPPGSSEDRSRLMAAPSWCVQTQSTSRSSGARSARTCKGPGPWRLVAVREPRSGAGRGPPRQRSPPLIALLVASGEPGCRNEKCSSAWWQ